MTNQITVRKDDKVENQVPISASMTLGRHPSVDLQLEDPMISRQHARVTREGGNVFITDLGSVNGVRVNGQRIDANTPFQVSDGDVAEINLYQLVFTLEGAPDETKDFDGGQTSALPIDTATVPRSSPNLEHLLGEGIPVWSNNQEVDLVIADIIEETHDVKTYRLVGQDPLLFSYQPGQFITLKLNIDGELVSRCYSISSSPSRPHTLELTVKRVSGGLVSNHLYERAKLGDRVTIQGPSGNFSCFNYPKQKIACIAAGSGITPVMSMARWIVDTTADVDVVMLISARSPTDIIFRKELELMSARHSGMQVYITVTSGWKGTESWTGLTGRVCPEMLRMVVPDLNDRHIFMCGPNPFTEALRDCLKQVEFPTQNIFSESFGGARAAQPPKNTRDVPKAPAHRAPTGATAAPVAPAPEAPATQFAVNFQSSGVQVNTDGEGCLLDLAEANAVATITPGCRMGSCLMCKVKKVSGDVRMDDNMLPEDLQSQGFVLTCVGHPESDVVLEA